MLHFHLGAGSAWWSASAAVADSAQPALRASAFGNYRIRRDLGYGIGALVLGIAATLGGNPVTAFWSVAVAILVCGFQLYQWGEETYPGLHPAS